MSYPTKWREILRDMAEPDKNPFRPGTPLYQLFEESRPVYTQGGYVPAPPTGGGGVDTTDESNDPFEMFDQNNKRVADLEGRLKKVDAYNAELTQQLNVEKENVIRLVEANSKLYDEGRKSASKVDALYKSTNMLAELCTTLIRTLK
jgi:hypothetical protein